MYWASVSSLPSVVNTAASYTWTKTQTFNANLSVNGAIFLGASNGQIGQVLTSGGNSNAYWSTVTSGSGSGGVSATNGIITITNQVSANYSITAGNNALSVGPLTISAVVTQASGTRWVII